MAPVRRIAVGALQAARHRMAPAGCGEECAEAALGHLAARLRRQDRVERRAPDAGRAGVVGAGGDQHGAAVAHVFRDVVEIDHRQHALAGVAVEDDELEFRDLLLEQLAGRKSNQRKLVDRRAVLLLGRAQNGEMHEIDRGVRFKQIAPGALAGVRLAGHQQHAQLVAHAVDRDHRAIVDLGQLALERGGLDLDDVRPGMRDRHLDTDVGVDGDDALLQHVAVAPHDDFGGPDLGAVILDAEADGLRLADDAEARGLREHDAAVDLVGVAGDQRVQRRGKTEHGGVGRHVVHAPVSDHDRAGDAVGRHVGERRGQRREQPRALVLAVGLAGIGDAHFQSADALEPRNERVARGLRLLGAVAEILARALVDDDGGDRGDRVAVFARQRRIGERQHHQDQRDRAQQRAAAARQQQDNRDQKRHAERGPNHVGRHQRSE